MNKTKTKKSEGLANYTVQILTYGKTWLTHSDSYYPLTLSKARVLRKYIKDDGYESRIVTESGLIVE